MSKTKIEQKAITKVRELIDEIEFFKPLLNENDKGISWDGVIEMYNGDIDKKSNYDYTIDIQIKGRTTPTKKLGNKHRLLLDKVDLENYLKKDGTIVLLCLFQQNNSNYKIYYANLLPYNIRILLRQCSSPNIKIDMREINSPSHFEVICRNFKIDREMQKGIKESIFNEENLVTNDGKIAKFYSWEKDSRNFNPQSLVGTWKYIYTLEEKGYVTNISYAELTNLFENLNAKIYDIDKEIIYNDIKLETYIKGQKILFGKAFKVNLKEKNFNINICGTLHERIKQLKFISKLFKYEMFFINELEFKIDSNKKEENKFNKLLRKYIKIDNFFQNHNISKDINFDNWDDTDLDKLFFWINAIDEKKEVSLKSKISLVGSLKIKDLRISVFAKIKDNKKFKVESIWNNNICNKYYFKYKSNLEEIDTNNLYLVLNSEAYQADDINILEMENIFNKDTLSDGEYNLMNMQVLEVLKAYDIEKKENLLQYAKFLTEILLKRYPENPIYFINNYQILKREGNLTNEIISKLIDIREKNQTLEIKLACNLLLDNKTEVKILKSKLDTETLEVFKRYPISIYL